MPTMARAVTSQGGEPRKGHGVARTVLSRSSLKCLSSIFSSVVPEVMYDSIFGAVTG